MNLRIYIICLSIFMSKQCFCQKTDSLNIENVKSYFEASINYLVQTQCDSTIPEKQYKGEWKVSMELTEPFFFLGKRQKKRDSNCFTVSAIHNFLSEIYLTDTSLFLLKPTLLKAFSEIQTFRTGERFNFWKALPPQRDLKIGKEPKPIPLVRRPTNFKLKTRFVNNSSNVPNDADDTSLGNLATFYHNKIFADTLKIASSTAFDKYIDLNRKNSNWFNVLFHGLPNSGAFLTWHTQEHEFKYWNKLRSALNGAFVFVPISPSFPKAYKPWMPFMANDVDIVVNANVLTYLSNTNQVENSIGKKGALAMINHLLKEEHWQNTAIYYPNFYHIHYAVARTYASGFNELHHSCEIILAQLINSQKADGRFESGTWLNNKDIIQSTTYGLHALLDLKEKGITVPKQNIDNAVKYLISKATINSDKVNWNGGVYFSGGTFVRGIMVWKSDAYTTAMIAKCLQKWLKMSD